MSDRGTGTIGEVSAARIAALRDREARLFAGRRPISRKAYGEGISGFLGGVPMHWMLDWPMPFPIVVEAAKGATITDIDGIALDDFCFGDTGSMFGHSPAPVARAIRRQARRGLTYMLPSADTLELGRLLADMFGLPWWQIATTASDANRFALRLARAVTGRPKILVFNGCYHGAVEETFVELRNGRAASKPGLAGQFRDLAEDTRVVEFNDAPALEAALRRITRAAGTLLLIDETHTISSGRGGYARIHGLDPDIFVLGKPVAGGVPASVWGLSQEVADRWTDYNRTKPAGYSGIGTTLSANPLQFAAMKATLTEVMTPENYRHMDRRAERLADGLAAAIARTGLPWHVARVGARVEFICAPGPLKNGAEAGMAHAPALEAAIHLALVNRGCLIAPFHNMMLVSPATKKKQVDRLVAAFGEMCEELAG